MKKIFLFLIFALCFNFKSFSQIKDTTKKEEIPIYEIEEDKITISKTLEMPEFPGGNDSLMKFIKKNIHYSKDDIQGTVYVTFIIDEKGNVIDAKILRGLSKECDEEALRIVKLMPKWKSGKQNGKNVRVQFNLPIKFL